MTQLPPDPQVPPVPPAPPVPPLPPVPPAPGAGAPVPYPGQPTPFPGAQPPYAGQPQYPAQPPQYPGAPVPPGQPPRRGLPAWAWVVLGVVAALFIGLIVAMAVLIPRMMSEFADAAGPSPVPTEQAPAPTDDPGDDDTLGGTVYSLDQRVTLAAGPFWGIDFDEDWQIEIWDTNGVNQMSHAESGCKMYTFQGTGVPDAAGSASDREATELTIPVALGMGLPWDASGEPSVQPDGSWNATLDFGPDQVEMAQLRAQYTSTGGEARERVMILRAFLPTNNVLLAQVDCPAGSTELTDRIDDLTVSQY